MKRLTIYKDQARYYDLIYSWKDYKKEAETIRQLIAKHKKSTGRDLLEVACGTGGHIQYLKDHFRATGTDINNGMLGVARKKVKGVRFQQADIVTLNLGREFDAIICIFSSIGYLRTDAALKKTLRNFTRHLKTEGVVIIEPWLTKGGYTKGHPAMGTYGDDNTKIARLSVSNVRGDISIMDMHHLIAERNKGEI